MEIVLSGTFTRSVTMALSFVLSPGIAVAASVNTLATSLLASMSARVVM